VSASRIVPETGDTAETVDYFAEDPLAKHIHTVDMSIGDIEWVFADDQKCVLDPNLMRTLEAAKF